MKFLLDHHASTGCVLCELANSTPSRENLLLYRGEYAYVVMNKYPYNSGHLMVVPRKHTALLTDLDDATLLSIHKLIRDGLEVLKKAYKPAGFNVGMNLGEAGGAGIREHLHYHLVPRWNGDTNFMPVLGEVKVLPESLEESFDRLFPVFMKLPRSPN